MPNHNIRITNPKGDQRMQFLNHHTRKACMEWMEEYGPAPLGWKYEIINVRPNKRKYPEYILITGYDNEDNLIDERKAGVRHNNGRWYTPRMAKRDARAQGAIWFTREKVWKNGQGR